MSTKLKLKEKGKAIEATNRKMLGIAAADAKTHFEKSFDDEGFTDEHLVRWEPRKKKIRSLAAVALGKKTLTGKTRRLKKLRKSVGSRKATIFTDPNIAYAAIHNEGLMGRAWGKNPFRMPKRKFLGNSKSLERRTLAKWASQLRTAIRNA